MPRHRQPTPALTAAVEILRAADCIRVRSAAVISPRGLTLSQYNALRILRGAKAPLPTMEVRRRLIERTPGITRILKRLEQMGLVIRRPSASDGRASLCEITPAGLKRLREFDRPVERGDQDAMVDLSKADVTQLTRLLRRIK